MQYLALYALGLLKSPFLSPHKQWLSVAGD